MEWDEEICTYIYRNKKENLERDKKEEMERKIREREEQARDDGGLKEEMKKHKVHCYNSLPVIPGEGDDSFKTVWFFPISISPKAEGKVSTSLSLMSFFPYVHICKNLCFCMFIEGRVSMIIAWVRAPAQHGKCSILGRDFQVCICTHRMYAPSTSPRP